MRDPDAVSSILMVRVSVAAATNWPRVFELLQLMAVLTLPVAGSIFWSNNSPYHFTVVKVAEKMSLSCWLTLGVEVAAAEAAPVRTAIAAIAADSPATTAAGSRALKYLPWPFTAACHRSSTACRLSATGFGQT